MDFHGGNVYRVFREKKVREILDYSSNINPLGMPESLKKAVLENMGVLERYPDPEYVELREKIAEKNGLKKENIIVGNGATEIIFLFLKVLNLKKVLIVSPTFSEYERAAKASGSIGSSIEIEHFRLEEKEGFRLNTERIERELEKQYGLLILCNPNNPTGNFLEASEIARILKKCDEMNTKLLVDEAFIDFVENCEEKTAVKIPGCKKNLLVIRAFTKFFAIPGLRLGYGICFDGEIMLKMAERKETWSVNNFAALAGAVLLEDTEYIRSTERWIREEKKYMFEKMSEIDGIRPYKSEVNFILARITDEMWEKGVNAEKIQAGMLEEGVLVRNASNFVYLDEKYFRLAVKDRANNKKVLEKLRKVLKSLV